MKNAVLAAALTVATFGAAAQDAPAPNPDRNLEAARSYGAFAPAPAPKAVKTETSTRRVNGSASRDWALRDVA
jgi:hypothetical protein